VIRTFFKHGSNAVLVAALLAAAIAFARGALHFSLLGVAIGAVVFLSSEYTTHRFLFHAKPTGIPFVLRLQHLLHYDHHVDPAKLDLLFLPLWFTVPVAALYFAVYYAIVRDVSLATSLVFGSVLALTYYEWVHYVAHIPFVPKTPIGRYVKKYHLWHHFKNEHLWYGVTNPSMDFVMGTYRNVEDADRSTTVRELF